MQNRNHYSFWNRAGAVMRRLDDSITIGLICGLAQGMILKAIGTLGGINMPEEDFHMRATAFLLGTAAALLINPEGISDELERLVVRRY